MHNALVDNDLFSLFAVGSIIVELQGLHELVLVVRVPLIGLDDGHAPLVRLDDVHGEILYVVLKVLSNQVTFHRYGLFGVFTFFVAIFIGVVPS